MTWWIKARRAHTVLLGQFLLFCLLALLWRDTVLDLPSFLAGALPAPIVALLPVLLCAGLALCLDSRLSAAEATAVRPVARLDTALVVVTVLAACATGLVAWSLGGTSAGLNLGRDTAFLVGLMLLVRSVAGSRAVLAPVAWGFFVLFLGRGPGGHVYFWTVLLRPGSDPIADAAAGLAFAAGLTALLIRPVARTDS
ncbi:hypothetical protein ABZ686_18990 [Streptomyces sp. NPDC006992]|uniref:hypothetical protein n=1 Tax=Streptomyces sp. NPDC006992 TaxID=3155601 RepID=UPI0033DEE1FB